MVKFSYFLKISMVLSFTIFGTVFAHAVSDNHSINIYTFIPVICKTEQSIASLGSHTASISLDSFCNTYHTVRILPKNQNGEPLQFANYYLDGKKLNQDSNGYITLRDNAPPIKTISSLTIDNISPTQNISLQIETLAH